MTREKMLEIEEEILKLVEAAPEMTQSDIQGAAQAIAMKFSN